MSADRRAAVDRYVTGVLVAPDAVLDAALAASAAAGLPAHDATPAQGGGSSNYSCACAACALPELLAAEPRVRATTLQTVGAEGYDGVALAHVTA